jgi:lipopolysaccharide biosynthesis protein
VKSSVQRLAPDREFSVAVPLGCAAECAAPDRPIAVIAHIYYPEQTSEIEHYLRNIPFPTDLFISTDTRAKAQKIAQVFRGWDKGKAQLRLTPNRGRDIAPKLVGYARVHLQYDYVLHLHSKASTHTPEWWPWRGYLFETLLGSPEIVRSIFAMFAAVPRLGMVAPHHYEPLTKRVGWGDNFPLASDLAKRIGFRLNPDHVRDFPSGSMFWARSVALHPLLRLKLSYSDFPEEAGQVDGTLAHAVERLFFVTTKYAGLQWLRIAVPGFFHRTETIVSIDDPHEVAGLLDARSAPVPPTVELLRTLKKRRQAE